jgi:hypothetical protein
LRRSWSPSATRIRLKGGMGIGYALGMQVELLRGGKMWAR